MEGDKQQNKSSIAQDYKSWHAEQRKKKLEELKTELAQGEQQAKSHRSKRRQRRLDRAKASMAENQSSGQKPETSSTETLPSIPVNKALSPMRTHKESSSSPNSPNDTGDVSTNNSKDSQDSQEQAPVVGAMVVAPPQLDIPQRILAGPAEDYNNTPKAKVMTAGEKKRRNSHFQVNAPLAAPEARPGQKMIHGMSKVTFHETMTKGIHDAEEKGGSTVPSVLRIGDIVYLQDESIGGFAYGEGFVDSLVGVVPGGPDLPIDGEHTVDEINRYLQQNTPISARTRLGRAGETFQNCLFRVVTKLTYEASKELEKRMSLSKSGQRHVKRSHLVRLKDQAEREAKKNEKKLQEAVNGLNTSCVLYGQTVQLQHIQSEKFLVAKTDIVARCDKKSMQITLDEGSDSCWFDIQPRFRTRLNNTEVYYGDQIKLQLTLHPSAYLHVGDVIKDRFEGDRLLNRVEINLSSLFSSWKFGRFHSLASGDGAGAEAPGKAGGGHLVRRASVSGDESNDNFLKVGQVIRLFHTEQCRFITASSNRHVHDKRRPYLRQSAVPEEPSHPTNLTSKSLFVIEHVDCSRGGLVTFFRQDEEETPFRIRHVPTGRYLTVTLKDDEGMRHESPDNNDDSVLTGTEAFIDLLPLQHTPVPRLVDSAADGGKLREGVEGEIDANGLLPLHLLHGIEMQLFRLHPTSAANQNANVLLEGSFRNLRIEHAFCAAAMDTLLYNRMHPSSKQKTGELPPYPAERVWLGCYDHICKARKPLAPWVGEHDKAKASPNLFLTCSTEKQEQDSFAAFSASCSEVRDVNFILARLKHQRSIVDLYRALVDSSQGGHKQISQPEVDRLLDVLSDSVFFFVRGADDDQQLDVDPQTKAKLAHKSQGLLEPGRQGSARELKLIDEFFRMYLVPRSCGLSDRDICKIHLLKPVRDIQRLISKVIRESYRDNRRCQFYVARTTFSKGIGMTEDHSLEQSVDHSESGSSEVSVADVHLQSLLQGRHVMWHLHYKDTHVGHRCHLGGIAGRTFMEQIITQLDSEADNSAGMLLTEVLADNKELVDDSVDEKIIQRFLDLISNHGPQAQYMSFLKEVCSCNNKQIITNQELLLRMVYSGGNAAHDAESPYRLNRRCLLVETMMPSRDSAKGLQLRQWPGKQRILSLLREHAEGAKSPHHRSGGKAGRATSFRSFGRSPKKGRKDSVAAEAVEQFAPALAQHLFDEGLPDLLISWSGHDGWRPNLSVEPSPLFHSARNLKCNCEEGVQTPADLEAYEAATGCKMMDRSWVTLEQIVWPLDPPACFSNAMAGSNSEVQDWESFQKKIASDLTGNLQEIFDRRHQLAEYYAAQLEFFGEMLLDRSYNCISAIEKQFSYELLLCGIINEGLPFRIRAVYTTLMRRCYVDRFPQKTMSLPTTIHVYSDLATVNVRTDPRALPQFVLDDNHFFRSEMQADGLPYPLELSHPDSNKFALLQYLISHFFAQMSGDVVINNREENTYAQMLLRMLENLTEFGFYGTLDKLKAVCDPLIRNMDGRADKMVEEDAHHEPDAHETAAGAQARAAEAVVAAGGGKGAPQRWQVTAESLLVMRSRCNMASVLSTISHLRMDYRIRTLLYMLKRSGEKTGSGAFLKKVKKQQKQGKGAKRKAVMRSKAAKMVAPVPEPASEVEIGVGVGQYALTDAGYRCFQECFESKEGSCMDLEKLSTAPLKTILMDLIMHEDKTLMESAFMTMYEIFSQRSGLVRALQGVQVLVEDESADNYKRLKETIATLRAHIESYETWGVSNDFGPEDRHVMKFVTETLVGLQELCTCNTGDKGLEMPRRVNQEMLRRLGVHEIVLLAHQIPFSDAQEAMLEHAAYAHLDDRELRAHAHYDHLFEIKTLSNLLLCKMLLGNPRMQEEMFPHCLVFSDQAQYGVDAVKVLSAIFCNNKDLSTKVLMNQHTLTMLHDLEESISLFGPTDGNIDILDLFGKIMCPRNQPLTRNQDFLLKMMTKEPELPERHVPCLLYTKGARSVERRGDKFILGDHSMTREAIARTADGYKMRTRLLGDTRTQIRSMQAEEDVGKSAGKASALTCLRYHTGCVNMLAMMSRGKNALSEAKCQDMLSLYQVIAVLTDERNDQFYGLLKAFARFLYEVYFETLISEVRATLSTDKPLWRLLVHWTNTLKHYKGILDFAGNDGGVGGAFGMNVLNGGVKYTGENANTLEGYVYSGIIPAVMMFYTYVYDPDWADDEQKAITNDFAVSLAMFHEVQNSLAYWELKALHDCGDRLLGLWRLDDEDITGGGAKVLKNPHGLRTEVEAELKMRIRGFKQKAKELQAIAVKNAPTLNPQELVLKRFNKALAGDMRVQAGIRSEFNDMANALMSAESLTDEHDPSYRKLKRSRKLLPTDLRESPAAVKITFSDLCSRLINNVTNHPDSGVACNIVLLLTQCVLKSDPDRIRSEAKDLGSLANMSKNDNPLRWNSRQLATKRSEHEMKQVEMAEFGAADMVVQLLARTSTEVPEDVCLAAMLLGITLLQGGNTTVQEMIFASLQNNPSSAELFFRNLVVRMDLAQEKILANRTERKDAASAAKAVLVQMDELDFAARLNSSEAVSSRIQAFTSIICGDDEEAAGGSDSLSEVKQDRVDIKVQLRLLQLFCEGHNARMQHALTKQQGDNALGCSVDTPVVTSVADLISNLATNSSDILAMDEVEFDVVQCALEFLIECVQGPCELNQRKLALETSLADACRKIISTSFEADSDEFCRVTEKQAKLLKHKCVQMFLALLEGREDHIYDHNGVRGSLREVLRKSPGLVPIRVVKVREMVTEERSEREARSVLGLKGGKKDAAWETQYLDEGFDLITLQKTLELDKEGVGGGGGGRRISQKQREEEKEALKFFEERHCSIEVLWGHAHQRPHLERVHFPIPIHCQMLRKEAGQHMRQKIIEDLDYSNHEEKIATFAAYSGKHTIKSTLDKQLAHVHNLQNYLFYRLLHPHEEQLKNMTYKLSLVINAVMLASLNQPHAGEIQFRQPYLELTCFLLGVAQLLFAFIVWTLSMAVRAPLIYNTLEDKRNRRLNEINRTLQLEMRLQLEGFVSPVVTVWDMVRKVLCCCMHRAQMVKVPMKMASMKHLKIGGMLNNSKDDDDDEVDEDMLEAMEAEEDPSDVSKIREVPPTTYVDVVFIFAKQMVVFAIIGFIWFDYIENSLPTYIGCCIVASLFMSPPSVSAGSDKPWLSALRDCLGEKNDQLSFWLCLIHDCVTDPTVFYYILYLFFAALGLFVSEVFYAFHLLDLVIQTRELKNVIRSVTIPANQLGLTLLLGVFIVYQFSLLTFYISPEEMTNPENAHSECESLLGCFFAFLHYGILSGGGIGDYISFELGHRIDSNPHEYPTYIWRMLLDLGFFIIVLVLLLNIIFGITIDQFGALRDQAKEDDENQKEFCFVCNIKKSEIDINFLQKNVRDGFEYHIKEEHNMWSYMMFMIHLDHKDPTTMTGVESCVYEKLMRDDTSWIPTHRALCINNGEGAINMNEEMSSMKVLFQKLQGQLGGLSVDLARRMTELNGKITGMGRQVQQQQSHIMQIASKQGDIASYVQSEK